MPTAELETDIATDRGFDPEQFDIRHDVPVFDEHEADDGTKYTPEILESICENQNKRIRDTGDYTAICVGHTPTPEERAKGAKPPRVVGYSGPFYVGRIGKERPRACIMARHWATYKEDADEVKRCARRSVEIYEEENPHDRYFDPIALLGAEMPRLDLGLAYSRLNPTRKVSRYAMAAPAGSNTFMPEQYQNNEFDQEAGMAQGLSDDDIQRLVAAIEQTDWAQWAIQQMDSDFAKGDETAVEDPMAGAPPMAGQPPIDAAGAPPAAPAGDIPPPGDEANMDPTKPKDDELEPTQYSRMASEVARYRKENEALSATVTTLQTTVDELKAERVAIKRYSRIDELSNSHALDSEEEYKRADGMTDEQFEGFYGSDGVVVKHYAKLPVGAQLPRIAAASKLAPETGPSAAKIERAKAIASRYANEGKSITWAQAVEEAGKETAAA